VSKPRKFESKEIQARGECLVADGVRVVDMRLDVYDDAASVRELTRFADWINRATQWMAEGNEMDPAL